MKFSIEQAEDFVSSIFEKDGVLPTTARSVARALVAAEAAGQSGHGFRRIPVYIKQVRVGKVDAKAVAVATRVRPAVLSIDAHLGYAYPAIDLAVDQLPAIAREQGIALAVIGRSHHAGVMALTVERFAEQGLVAFMVANAPASMAPWGGIKPLYGTNPIAFAAPVEGSDPLVIDLALSKVARGKIMAARQKGQSIPEGWALDASGQATTDPHEAINGTMVPAGDAKGAALALMVEVMAAGLTGGNFGFQASSLLDDTGTAPSLGHTLIAIDPSLAGDTVFAKRLALMASEIEGQENARLPGRRSQGVRKQAAEDGIVIDDDILVEIEAL
ncbi:(2R)-3-sulfolactate dehydrogenase (NADP+) [Rhizobium skierniewicense]|uniref:(2R)-3-sulfolactate dehydrogenase (NADP+) n=1 Tax=Rhizobium skierniewicense TaxID=984260 RepID=A0A7W6C8M3_9HYPH|nr:Ldh family oxidoreductase [Rhizobium skierniewicense]MBB3946736.1 (2R)-3-sulfolactate dehydrogenase (NADP+) [Rhizobium skierniewicense]NTF30605.1 Ldh family oxidoreductase [Rhizobium skierniewicense]